MGWNTGVTYVSTSPVTDTLLNGIGYDFRTWGGNVDASGYNLTNLAEIHGASNVLKLFTNSVERVRVTDTGLGIGGIAPSQSLAFPAATGDKFTLYNGQMWGMGIQSGVMQLITANSGGDFAFGYGSSASFTEVLRVKGTGIVKQYNTPVYADNAAAIAGGLTAGMQYRTSTGVRMEVY